MLPSAEFRELLSALSTAGAEYLLVGGYALAAHGIVRATSDLDLCIGPGEANALRVEAALQRFGTVLGEPHRAALRELGRSLRIGDAPHELHLHNTLTGLDFETAHEGRMALFFGPLEVPTLGLRALFANKRAMGRPMDRVDLRRLVAEQRFLQERAARSSREAYEGVLDKVRDLPPDPEDEP